MKQVEGPHERLRREHLRQPSDAQQFQYAWCHVGEFQNAEALLHGGCLKTDQRSKPRTIQRSHVAKINNDAAALGDERSRRLLDLIRNIADQLAMTMDRRNLIPVFIFIF